MAAKKRSKSKRGASGTPRSYSQLYKGDTQVDDKPVQATEQASTPIKETQTDWGAEYGYVMRDLRALAVVSVLVIGLMIGVGFLL